VALKSNGWSTETSGGEGSSFGGHSGLTATNSSRYRVFEAGGPGGETFIDLCVWPSQPSNDDCGSEDDS